MKIQFFDHAPQVPEAAVVYRVRMAYDGQERSPYFNDPGCPPLPGFASRARAEAYAIGHRPALAAAGARNVRATIYRVAA